MNELIYYDLKKSSGLPHSLSVQVAREIGRRIVAGIYEPTKLIEEENSLANRFSVSRSVVRDAVKILVGKGMLEVRRGIGTRVKSRSEWMLLDDDVLAWHQSAPIRSDFLDQLIEIRLLIEPKAASWAAERGSDEEHLEIENAINQMELNIGSNENYVVADAQFHSAILKASNNEILVSMEGIIFSALLDSIRVTNKDPSENKISLKYHKMVAISIKKRDPEKAESSMELLLRDAQNRLKNRLVRKDY